MNPHSDKALVRLAQGKREDIAAAIGSLRDGVEAGEADADRWLALLTAAGVGLPQSWPGALDHLERAAARGSASALGQLRALAPPLTSPDPRNLRGSIGSPDLNRHPIKRVLNAQPRVVAIDGFITQTIAGWMIERASERLERAQVFRGANASETGSRTNSACRFEFLECDVVILLTRSWIANAIGVPVAALENSQVLHYKVGEEFSLHHDWLDPADPGQAQEIEKSGQRIVTFLIYLNDDFSGGETSFPKLGLAHRGRLGDGLYFANIEPDGAPSRNTLHAGLSPNCGEKWVFSQWVRNMARI